MMETSASLSAGLTHTPRRGWAVVLLSRLQMSSMMLVSFTFGVFLPFIKQDLQLSPLQAGLLQGIWWATSACLALPLSIWLSRFPPARLVLFSMLLDLPCLFLQSYAGHFLTLFLLRCSIVACHEIATPARPLLLQQWVAPGQYAQVNAVGLSQHSILLALAVSCSPWLITVVGSWRLAYVFHSAFWLLQMLLWMLVAQQRYAPVPNLQHALEAQQESPFQALWLYPQGWLLGLTMFSLAATWTAVVTFLPTLLLEQHGLRLTMGGPLLACLYYGLIPCGVFGGMLASKVRNRRLLLGGATLCNMLLGVAIALTPAPWLLALLLTGMGMVWIVSPVVDVLPFEFPGIRPRQVAVIASLVKTFSGLGFATGPVLTGWVAERTGSLQTGLVVLCVCTGVNILAGFLYPRPARTTVDVPRNVL